MQKDKSILFNYVNDYSIAKNIVLKLDVVTIVLLDT